MVNKLEHSVAVKQGLRLDLSTKAASVKIVNGEDEVVSITYDSTEELNDNLSEYFMVEYDDSKNRLSIEELEQERKEKQPEGLLILKIPKQITLSVNTKNGSILMKEITAESEISGKNGKVEAFSCSGPLKVGAKNGMVKIENHSGDLEVESANGEVSLSGGESESLKVKSKNGKIRVLNLSSVSSIITNDNGSIYYDMPQLDKGNCTIENQNGRIIFTVPDGLSLNLSASNKNGGFHIGLEDHYESKIEKNRKIVSIVRSGGRVMVKLVNCNGSISVMSDKNRESNKLNHNELGLHNFIPKIFSGDNSELETKISETIEKKMHKLEDKLNKIPTAFGDKFFKLFNSFEKKQATETSVKTDEEIQDRVDFESKVLQMVESGTISPEEAEKLLDAIQGGNDGR